MPNHVLSEWTSSAKACARILTYLPRRRRASIWLLVAVQLVLGCLPAVLVLTSGTFLGRLPNALATAASVEAVWAQVLPPFAACAFALFGQQALLTWRNVLGSGLERQIDGEVRESVMQLVVEELDQSTLEANDTLNGLSEAVRHFESQGTTPGAAVRGVLALLARYVQLVTLLSIVAVVGSLPGALALALMVLLFRFGQRGGLRRFAGAWSEVSGLTRRSRYLRDLALNNASGKEARIFGLTDWLSRQYCAVTTRAQGHVAEKRRNIYLKTFLAISPIGLVLVASSLAYSAAQHAYRSEGIASLLLLVQAALAATMLGEFYPECDVQTQFGLLGVDAVGGLQSQIKRVCNHVVEPPVQMPVAALPVQALQLSEVTFAYPGAQSQVLNGVSADFPVGKCTAIVGANGAGKSTLVKLLTRLYEPTGGAIRVGDQNISNVDVRAWRRQLAVVFQDFNRYELSAHDNIHVGACHGVDDQTAIEQAAVQSGIHARFATMPRGLQTVLSPAYRGGVELSGGQWQRIAIARALFAVRSGAKFLILDEPTSALDISAEYEFFRQLKSISKGVTSILISHRFSSVREADQIIVLDEGKVAESGSHDQLMTIDGIYARLFRLQSERFAMRTCDATNSHSEHLESPHAGEALA